MICKISATLLNSLQWYLTCPKSWKSDARTTLINQLNRVKSPHTSATSRGTTFEHALNKAFNADTEDDFWALVEQDFVENENHIGDNTEYVVRQFYKYGHNAKQQEKVLRLIDIDAMTYQLFGIADLIAPKMEAIYDIKTTVNYKESKYKDSAQHLLYMAGTGVDTFKYLVAEYDDLCPVDYHEVTIKMPAEEAQRRFEEKIRELVVWLKGSNLWDKYVYTYSGNYKESGIDL